MKKILQALDGAASKPVEGVSSMARFLRVVKEGDLNQPAGGDTTWAKVVANASGSYDVVDFEGNKLGTNLSQADATKQAKIADEQYKKVAPGLSSSIQVQPESVAEDTGISRFISIISEGKGPLNRPTAAESITMQHYTAPTKKSITTPTLNVAVGAKPSMIGKYFKTVSEEFNADANQSKTRARQLAERVIERVVGGQEPAPGINRLTGKPIEPQAEPAVPAAPAAVVPLNKRFDPRFKNGPEPYTIDIDGVVYKFAGRDKTGPGTGEVIKVPAAVIGIRGLGAVSVELGKDGLFYSAPKTESVSEELNPPDAVTVDIPLLLRLLEYAKEDAKTDMDLHNVTEKLIQMSREGETLSMKDYDAIVGDQLALPAPDENNDGEEDY